MDLNAEGVTRITRVAVNGSNQSKPTERKWEDR